MAGSTCKAKRTPRQTVLATKDFISDIGDGIDTN
ncbi:hypothetical protein IWX65_002734 [Arthrobacter sp. CAN_A214]